MLVARRAAQERPIVLENLTTITAREHQKIAPALTTNLARVIVLANLTTIARERIIVLEHRRTIARQTMRNAPAQEFRVLEIRTSPAGRIEEQAHPDPTLQTIRNRVETPPRTTISHGQADPTTIDPVGMSRAQDRAEPDSPTVGQVRRTAMPVQITDVPTMDGPTMLDRRMHVLIMGGPITDVPTMPDPTMRDPTMHLLRNLEHRVPTIAVLPRIIVRLLSRTIVRRRQLTTGHLLHLRTDVKRHRRTRGRLRMRPKIGIKPHRLRLEKLRPHGLSHDPLLRLKISPGLRQDPPTIGSRSARQSPSSLVAAKMTTETEITKTTKTRNNFGRRKRLWRNQA